MAPRCHRDRYRLALSIGIRRVVAGAGRSVLVSAFTAVDGNVTALHGRGTVVCEESG